MHGMILLALCTAFSVTASVFLKQASQGLGEDFVWTDLIGNHYVWFGGMAYATAFVGYIYTLRIVPLSLVQPTITAGASVLTVLIAVWFFREQMSPLNWIGLFLVCSGIFLLFVGRA
jgi:multidrug transporter EmrE-like cation transporter